MNLIITGCIKVNENVPYLTIKNVNQRYKEYCETIRWAIEETCFQQIIFCDNSNYNFDSQKYAILAKKYKKNFEYLTFSGNEKEIQKKGKGYGEGEIIQYVLQKSNLLKDENYFYKITGRLKIKNVNQIIKSNEKNLFMNKFLTNQLDTRFYGINKHTFVETLNQSYQDVDDLNSYFLEHVYFDTLNKYHVKYRTFYKRPLFSGISGSTGTIYQDERKKNESLISLLFFLNIYNNKIFYNIKKTVKRFLKNKK